MAQPAGRRLADLDRPDQGRLAQPRLLLQAGRLDTGPRLVPPPPDPPARPDPGRRPGAPTRRRGSLSRRRLGDHLQRGTVLDRRRAGARMRPPTQYFGSKGRLAPWIASLLPAHRTYVEPFAGSAAVLFAKAPSPTEVINDADGDLVMLFRVLRDHGPELARALALTPYARAELRAADLDIPGLDELERARRVFVRLNLTVGKTLRRSSGFAAAFNTNGADHAHKFTSLVDHLPAAAQRLRRVIIENRSAAEVIAKYGASNA